MRNNVEFKEATTTLTLLVLTCIGILTLINVYHMIWTIVSGCRVKRRMKALEKIRQQNILIAREKNKIKEDYEAY